MRKLAEHPLVLSPLLLLFCSTTAIAAVCNVPSGSHPTIQGALDDPACTEVVIAAGAYVESLTVDRTLDITGASSSTTVIEGQVVATGTGVSLTLDSLKVDASAPSAAGCYPEVVDVSGGAALTSNDLVAINGDGDACVLFRDGFEAGDTDAWSGGTP